MKSLNKYLVLIMALLMCLPAETTTAATMITERRLS